MSGEGLEEEDFEDLYKQPENYRTLGFWRLRLRTYNSVDSTKVAKKRIRKNEKLHKINDRKRAKMARINEKRRQKAIEKGKDYYKPRIIELKDTVAPRKFVREWALYSFGEPPVVFDSSKMERTAEQMARFLKRKGYYEGSVRAETKLRGKKKIKVTYDVDLGERYYIDSVYTTGGSLYVKWTYDLMMKNGDVESLVGQPFDREMLDDYRTDVARFMRNGALYGFSPTHIHFLADSNAQTRRVTLGIQFRDRIVSETGADTVIRRPHVQTDVRHVYFHILDTNGYEGNFEKRVNELGLNLFDGVRMLTIDTLRYQELTVIGTDSLDKERMAYFYYNGELIADAGVIESQNYLEEGRHYREDFLNKSYTYLMQLGIFQSVKPEIVEVDGEDKIDVHYYLVPNKRQSFRTEPRFTNSNGFLGLSGMLTYSNNNLLRGAEKLTVSLTGGIESQPPVYDDNSEQDLLNPTARSFNTFEIGPSFVYDIPGLFPTKVTALTKRHRPRTIVSAGANFQRRSEFTRNTFQANYGYKMFVLSTQIFQYGLPFFSSAKYVKIDKSEFFDNQLKQFNDLFLRNAYSDQLIYHDWKFQFEYTNADKPDRKSEVGVYYLGNFDPVGNMLSLFEGVQDTNALGRHMIFGVPYSRFVRVDNDLVLSKNLSKTTSLHFRGLLGAGLPTGNKETSLPFDYSFFAGGSNDNRGWTARGLGPGAYKYILDTNRTITQIGDVRLSASLEYRFTLSSLLKMAVFTDAGNVWLLKEDQNRLGSQLSKDWYKEIAYSGGVGFRFDLDFFIIRLDLGLKINNHTLPAGARWIWQSREPHEQELLDKFGAEDLQRLREANKIPRPFQPHLHFGIGYPF